MSRRVDRRKERKLLRDVYYALMDVWGADTRDAVERTEADLLAAVDRLQAFDNADLTTSAQQPQPAEVLH